MGLNNVKDSCMLVDFLESFLDKVFTREFLEDECKRLETFSSHGRPEELRYLKPVNVHRAARWYKLLHEIKANSYSFDLRFSSNVEEFMKLVLFAYSMETLIEHNVLQLDKSSFVGRLRDRGMFEPLMYQAMIASNYASKGFDVVFPELSGGRVDIYARKGDVEVYAECKTLKRNEKYVDVAVEVGSWLSKKKINILLDITLSETPRDGKGVKKVSSIVERAVEEGKQLKEDYVSVSFIRLPEHMMGSPPINVKA
ncbi:MAG: hypothetical protein H5T50_08690, partial [Nitrososphaeria archaeon]|nr:hypothetical protein [Nitrososphaeria archaeon]